METATLEEEVVAEAGVPVWLVPLAPNAQEVTLALQALRTRPHRILSYHNGFKETETEEEDDAVA